MNTKAIINKLYNRIDILNESKQMQNRFYVSKALKLIEKLQQHDKRRSKRNNYGLHN